MDGDISHLIHRSPVPYNEVLLAIEARAEVPVDSHAKHYTAIVYKLMGLLSGRWLRIHLLELKASLFEHESGFKIILADELVYRKDRNHAQE